MNQACKQVVGSVVGSPRYIGRDDLGMVADDPWDDGSNRHGPEDMLAGVIRLALLTIASCLVVAACVDAVRG